MKKFILFAALAAGTISGAAAHQPVTFGIRAGVNLDQQKWTGGSTTLTSDDKVGFHVVGAFDVPLANLASSLPSWLYLQPGLSFTTRGGKSASRSFTNLYYVDLPVSLLVKLPVTNAVKIVANAGPSVGYAVVGKEKRANTSTDLFKGNDFTRLHFGLGFGGGLEFRRIYLGASYDLGLFNMSTNSNPSLKNRTLAFSLGYSF